MNGSEFLDSLVNSTNSGNTLQNVLNSVLEDSRKPKGIIGAPKMKTVKVKVISGKEGVISFRGIDLVFNKDGIAEVPALLKPEIELEMNFRPGMYSFVEEVIQEDITVLQMLEKAREAIEEDLNKLETSPIITEETVVEEVQEDNTQSDEEETKPAKKGRKGKI